MTQNRMFQPEAETADELGFMVMLLDLQDAAAPDPPATGLGAGPGPAAAG